MSYSRRLACCILGLALPALAHPSGPGNTPTHVAQTQVSPPMPEAMVKALRDEDGQALFDLIQSHPELVTAVDAQGDTIAHVLMAREYDDLAGMLLFLVLEPNLRTHGHGGDTLLHIAARKSKLDFVAVLVDYGALVDLNAKDDLGRTPLHVTTDLSVAEFLLEAGADAKVLDKQGAPPTIAAELEERIANSYWGLIRAVESGDTVRLQQLLARGLDPEQDLALAEILGVIRDPWKGNTPLQWAAALDSPTGLEALWKAWSASRAESERKDMAQQLLRQATSPKVIAYLVGQGASLQQSILQQVQDLRVGTALLKAGMVPYGGGAQAPSDFQWYYMQRESYDPGELQTFLEAILAASKDGEINRPLEFNEADFLAVEGGGPLHDATSHGQPQWVAWLLAHGADSNLATAEGVVPLHLAATIAGDNICALLLASRATPGLAEKDGWTPLHAAAYTGCLAPATKLIEIGAPVSSPDAAGNTPLHLAAATNNRAMCELLRKAGASREARNKEGEIPRDLASAEALKSLLAP